MPILTDLLKEENPEIKLNVVGNLKLVANVVGPEFFTKEILQIINNLTKDNQWRVRMAIFELVADLGILFGK